MSNKQGRWDIVLRFMMKKTQTRAQSRAARRQGERKAKKQVWSSVKSLMKLKEIMKKHTKMKRLEN